MPEGMRGGQRTAWGVCAPLPPRVSLGGTRATGPVWSIFMRYSQRINVFCLCKPLSLGRILLSLKPPALHSEFSGIGPVAFMSSFPGRNPGIPTEVIFLSF